MQLPACEPRLIDVLNDPIVQILMNRDAVAEETLMSVIDDVRRRIAEDISAEKDSENLLLDA